MKRIIFVGWMSIPILTWLIVCKHVEADDINRPTQMDWAFCMAQEETLISWLPRSNAAFLEAMPSKAARACLQMQTSPYSKVRDQAQKDLAACGARWQFWAMHFPVPEIQYRAVANLHKFSECAECKDKPSTSERDYPCYVCLGQGDLWCYQPWVDKKLEEIKYKKLSDEMRKIREQPEVAW